MEREKAIKLGMSAVATAALASALSTLAFSRRSKTTIQRRADYRSEWSGERHMPLEASHIDHTRDKDYDNPERGEYITTLEHLAYHVYWQRNPRYIGLEPQANDYAVQKLTERVEKFYRKSGVQVADMQGYIREQVSQKIEDHIDLIDPDM